MHPDDPQEALLRESRSRVAESMAAVQYSAQVLRDLRDIIHKTQETIAQSRQVLDGSAPLPLR